MKQQMKNNELEQQNKIQKQQNPNEWNECVEAKGKFKQIKPDADDSDDEERKIKN